ILIPGKCLISRHHGSYFNMLEGLSSLIRAYPSSKPKKPCIKPCNLKLFIIIFSLSFIFAGCSSNTSTNNDDNILKEGTITGQIVEPINEQTSTRNANALVVLDGENDYKAYASASWEAGEVVGGTFSKEGIKEGQYTMKVYKLGYGTVTKNITIEPNTTNDLGVIEMTPENPLEQPDGLYFYGMNTNKSPFDERAVRDALLYSFNWTDYESYVSGDEQVAGIANRIITPKKIGYNDTNLKYDYDLSKAEQVLNEAGYTSADTIDITINIPDMQRHIDVANKIKTYWEQVDQFAVSINKNSWENHVDNIGKGNFGLYYMGWFIDNRDPVFLFENFLSRYINEGETAKEYFNNAKMNLNNKSDAITSIHNLEKKILERNLMIPLHYFQSSQ
ncbi:MAG: hypothetical protein K9K76_01160, partial [Halanaerobiales bacterium]|nr:hypothetical protein [Halanaerobiales bacterium]